MPTRVGDIEIAVGVEVDAAFEVDFSANYRFDLRLGEEDIDTAVTDIDTEDGIGVGIVGNDEIAVGRQRHEDVEVLERCAAGQNRGSTGHRVDDDNGIG